MDTADLPNQLIDALLHGDVPRRIHAATEMGRIRDPAFFEPLVRALAPRRGVEPGSTRATESVIRALGNLGDQRAVEHIVAIIQEKQSRYGSLETAIEAFQTIGDPRTVAMLLAPISGRQSYDCRGPFKCLAEIGDSFGFDTFDRALCSHGALELAAARVLGVSLGWGRILDPRNIEFLQKYFQRNESKLSWLASEWASWGIRDTQHVEAIVETIIKRPSDDHDLQHIAIALVKHQVPRAYDYLAPVFENAAAGPRYYLAQALASISDIRNLGLLLTIMDEYKVFANSARGSLESILANHGREVPLEQLKSLSVLPDTEYTWEKMGDLQYETEYEEIDLAKVRGLAKDELARRDGEAKQ